MQKDWMPTRDLHMFQQTQKMKRSCQQNRFFAELGYDDVQVLQMPREGATLAGDVEESSVFQKQYKPCMQTWQVNDSEGPHWALRQARMEMAVSHVSRPSSRRGCSGRDTPVLGSDSCFFACAGGSPILNSVQAEACCGFEELAKSVDCFSIKVQEAKGQMSESLELPAFDQYWKSEVFEKVLSSHHLEFESIVHGCSTKMPRVNNQLERGLGLSSRKEVAIRRKGSSAALNFVNGALVRLLGTSFDF